MKCIEYIHFYEENGNWYADVSGHTKAENRMVAGSDKFLSSLRRYNESAGDYLGDVFLGISTEKQAGYYFKLSRIFHDKYGATYVVSKNKDAYFDQRYPKLCWLCNVVHTVLGEHPKTIYIMSY